jgi:hypothetical protein
MTDDPPVRRRILGAALRRFREQAGCTLDDAAGVLGCGRGAAGVNAAAAGLDISYSAVGLVMGTTFEIPVVGEVALVGTGLYLGADYLYHHWTPFRDVANDTGHAIASAAKDAWHDVTSFF